MRLFFLILFCFFFKQKTAYYLRISDWSSDGCSSDLRHGHRARHPVRGCVPDLRLCRGGAPDRQHHHRGTRPPWRRSVSPGGRVMRFRRWPRPTAYRETSRKRAAFLRKQRLEREALPLFAAQIDARQHGIDEEMARRAIWWVDYERDRRDQRAARWREARVRLFALDDVLRLTVRKLWRCCPYPADPASFADMQIGRASCRERVCQYV